MWLGCVTGLITDLHGGPSSYEVRRVIYNVDHRSDCLWEGCVFITPGLKGKTQRKVTVSQTALPLAPVPLSFSNVVVCRPVQVRLVTGCLCLCVSAFFYTILFSPATLIAPSHLVSVGIIKLVRSCFVISLKGDKGRNCMFLVLAPYC